MAVVKTMKWGNCTIEICDDAYRDLTPEQLAERQERIKNNILNICARARMRRLEEQEAQEEQNAKREEKHI